MNNQPPNHALHEAVRSAWIVLHPVATAEEYEAAMKKLAQLYVFLGERM